MNGPILLFQKMYKQILILVLQIAVIFSDDISTSPFCEICVCDNSVHDVTCEKEIAHYNIFNETKYWFNEEANENYPFRRITIRHSGIAVVSVIPESPLKILDLSHNRIQVIEEGSFKNLQNMVELHLSNNNIETVSLHPNTLKGKYDPGEYQPLKSLKVLKLDGNDIHTFHQDFFQHTTKLEVLDLHSNSFKHLDHSALIALGNLQFLKQFDLSYNNLEEIPEHIFHTLRRIEVLNLTGNMLKTIPKALSDAQNLQWLQLDGNPIGNITEQHGFPYLPKLHTLMICHMPKLQRIEAHSMCGLSALAELHIADNDRLVHLDGQALSERGVNVDSAQWPPLRKLSLRNNRLSYLNQSFLAHWDNLKDIDIRDNPWACECETQWMIDNLIPLIIKIDINETKNVYCSFPIEMNEVSLFELHEKKSSLRCLDLYGHRPERDATIVIGLLVGLLILIPLVLGGVFCYRNKWYGFLDSGPAAYSRKFYNRASPEEGDF